MVLRSSRQAGTGVLFLSYPLLSVGPLFFLQTAFSFSGNYRLTRYPQALAIASFCIGNEKLSSKAG